MDTLPDDILQEILFYVADGFFPFLPGRTKPYHPVLDRVALTELDKRSQLGRRCIRLSELLRRGGLVGGENQTVRDEKTGTMVIRKPVITYSAIYEAVATSRRMAARITAFECVCRTWARAAEMHWPTVHFVVQRSYAWENWLALKPMTGARPLPMALPPAWFRLASLHLLTGGAHDPRERILRKVLYQAAPAVLSAPTIGEARRHLPIIGRREDEPYWDNQDRHDQTMAWLFARYARRHAEEKRVASFRKRMDDLWKRAKQLEKEKN